MRKYCVLERKHEGDCVFPTSKPVWDRYVDGEFKPRVLSIPGVTVPGDRPRCRRYYDYTLVAKLDGGERVPIAHNGKPIRHRFVLLLRAWKPEERKLVWEIDKVADDLDDFRCWWSQVPMPHYRVVDQKVGHVWEPRLELAESHHPAETVEEIRGS